MKTRLWRAADAPRNYYTAALPAVHASDAAQSYWAVDLWKVRLRRSGAACLARACGMLWWAELRVKMLRFLLAWWRVRLLWQR